MTMGLEEKTALRVKSLKVPVVAIFIISSVFLQVLIAGVPIVTASPESSSRGNADAPRILSDVFPHNWSAHHPIHVLGGLHPAITSSPTGLSPSQIKAVYNLPSTGGNGTIAIIDHFDDPNVESDLGVFSSQFGLLPCTTANSCFEKHMMSSSVPADIDSADEISLDTQWAHAIAPKAKILLVEAKSDSGVDLLAAVDYARSRPDVVAISMSWGGEEFSEESSLDSHFTSAYGAIFFASSGDDGAGVLWPAVSPNVIGVGGTTLTFNGSLLTSETAWSGSGGGLSVYEPEPSYQVSYNVPGASGKRAVPDVSYNADYLNSPVWVYDTFGNTGWLLIGGTSAGAPQWAAIQSLGFSASNNNFYQDAKSVNYPSYFRDITSGSNGLCGFYCTATAGYDYVTGLGSPLTITYKPVMTTIIVSPSTATVVAGNTTNFTATTLDQFGNSINATLTWNSSNTTVGNITSAGVFTAWAAGTTNITASNGTVVSANVTVTVTAPSITGVIITPTTPSAGNEMNITVAINNPGTSFNGRVEGNVWAPDGTGKYLGWETVTIPSGPSAVTITGPAGGAESSYEPHAAGTYLYDVFLENVDKGQVYTNATDNRTGQNFTVGAATNVYISNVSLSASPTYGNLMTLNVTISNPTASVFTGTMYANVWDSARGYALTPQPISIAAGGSTTLTFSYTPVNHGLHSYDFFMVSANAVQNNKAPWGFPCIDYLAGVGFTVG